MNNQATRLMRGSFVLLRAGKLRLLVAQEEMGAAEYVAQAVQPTDQPGWFQAGEGDGATAVVALSERMEPLARFPQERFVITRLAADGAELAFAWDEARVLIDVQLERHPLPPAMRVEGAPIDGYVEHEDGQLALCTNAVELAAAAMAVPR